MKKIPLRSRLLSTPKSVAIFSVALCLGVAGATETVFAYRDHEMDANARNGREFEVGASTVDRAPMVELTYVPRLVTRIGTYQAAPASDERGPDYEFSSYLTSTAGPIVSAAASQSNLSELPPSNSSTPMSAIQVPATTYPAPVADTGTHAQPVSSEAPRPPALIRVQCGTVQCPEGEVCCNASCGTCAMPGEICSQLVCGMSTMPMSLSCGSNTCNVGEVCCNSSCGTCVRPGEQCDATKQCDNPIQYPYSVACGMATCNTSLVCCNPSCGTCARFGEPCSQEACD